MCTCCWNFLSFSFTADRAGTMLTSCSSTSCVCIYNPLTKGVCSGSRNLTGSLLTTYRTGSLFFTSCTSRLFRCNPVAVGVGNHVYLFGLGFTTNCTGVGLFTFLCTGRLFCHNACIPGMLASSRNLTGFPRDRRLYRLSSQDQLHRRLPELRLPTHHRCVRR